MSLEAFTAAYIECALWSSTDESDESGGEPLDQNYGPEDIAPATLDAMRAECRAFLDACAAKGIDVAELDSEQTGHDFWLTRNRHGAGFWDRGMGDLGRTLTDIAHAAGGADLYVGDDGKVYQS